MVAAPVGELAFGVAAGVAPDEFNGAVEGGDGAVAGGGRAEAFGGDEAGFVVEPVEDFLVADGLEGGEVTVLGKGTDFIDQSVINHLENPAVDSVIKYLTGPCKADFLYFEITFLLRGGLEGREGTARHEADFEGPHDALAVGDVDCSIAFRIQSLQFHPQRLDALIFEAVSQLSAQLQVCRRKIIKAVHQSVNIKAGTARHNQSLMPFVKETINQFESFNFIAAGGIKFRNRMGMNKIMLHCGKL